MPALSGGRSVSGRPARPRLSRPRGTDPAQGLEGCDHGSEAPGLALLVACEGKTSQPFRLCGDGRDVFLQDELRRWGGTEHLAEPTPVGGPPGGPPWRAASVPQQEGFETQRGCCEGPEGLFPCARGSGAAPHPPAVGRCVLPAGEGWLGCRRDPAAALEPLLSPCNLAPLVP